MEIIVGAMEVALEVMIMVGAVEVVIVVIAIKCICFN
jgi:hypothetical protein